jgi:multiple sugar transport system substrate-binding protein
MRRREVVGVSALGVVAAVALAAGCGRSRSPATEVTVWAMGGEADAATKLVRGFERTHPSVRVIVQQVPWSAAHEKLLTAFVGDALPDVVQVGSTWIPELVALGALAPVDEAVAAAARDDCFPGILAAHGVEGRSFSVPWYVDTRVFFYRSDLLAAAGAAEAPATWGGWVDVMRRVTAPPDHYAMFAPSTDWWLPVTIALQQGATLLGADGTTGRFETPAARRAFAFYLSLFRDGLAPAAGAAEIANVYQDFAAGYFAVYPSGPWDLGEFARRLPAALAERWATAPMPGADADHPGLSIAGGAGLAVTKAARHPALAWAVVEHLTASAQQLALYRLTGDLPARPSAWAAGALRDDSHTVAFWRQLQHVVPVPAVAEWEQIADALGRHLDRAIRAETTLDAALAALDRDVDGILEKRRWLLAHGGLS